MTMFRDDQEQTGHNMRMFGKVVASLSVLAFVVSIFWPIFFFASARSSGTPVAIRLNREILTILEFPSKKAVTSAVVIFASGDGGWSDLEETLARTLQRQGYEVVGVDSVDYAKTDYNLDILQSDFGRIAQIAGLPFGRNPPALIVGGYSMGAAQAIAVAGGPHPPPGLIGLLLLDPCSRGRYGLRASDQVNVLPTGPGTFSMEDFTQTMGKLRIVQWHAAEDEIDSRTWLNSLTATHKEYDFPNTGHSYSNNRGDFLHQLVQSLGWILEPNRNASRAVLIKN